MLIALPTNIRQGGKWPTVTNTVAYSAENFITSAKNWIQSVGHFSEIYYHTFTGLYFYGKLLTLPTNIWHGGKWLTVTNTLAFCPLYFITAVKSFIKQMSGHFYRDYHTFKGLYSKGKLLALPTSRKLTDSDKHTSLLVRALYYITFWIHNVQKMDKYCGKLMCLPKRVKVTRQ